MLGLARMVDAVHALEAVFKAEAAPWERELLDTVFEAAAAVRRAVDRLGGEGQDAALERLADLGLHERARGEAGARAGPVDREPADESDGARAGEVVRVRFDKLDALLNRVGEMVGAGAALDQTLAEHADLLRQVGLRRLLEARVEEIERVAELLREATMDLRLVPVGSLFGRFPALARDLARQQGKRVRVEVAGADVELDKSTIDALGEPLLHLVRNAVDHGIRPPEEREAAGRPPVGTIWLRAFREGDHVCIEVADDGSGLDRAAILSRARDQGVVGPGEQLERAELDELIFRPGFSTRAEVTTVSGRGVGMDVVRRRITGLRGSLSVEDRAGGGTCFVLRLPLTLAIVPVLLFETDGEVFALPAAEVEELVRRVRFERAGAADVMRHRERLVPVARPGRLFGWETDGSGGAGDGLVPFVVVVRRGSRAAAVPAERLLDEREVVVKALPGYLGALRGASGATVLPSGRVALLLDPGGLIELNVEAHRRQRGAG